MIIEVSATVISEKVFSLDIENADIEKTLSVSQKQTAISQNCRSVENNSTSIQKRGTILLLLKKNIHKDK